METTKTSNNLDKKYKEIQNQNTKAIQRLAVDYSSSSEDEELDEKTILDGLYQHYKLASSNESNNLTKTSTFLENALHSGAASCLICIGSIRRNESVWSCRDCYCLFHLNCIRRWANDSVKHLKVRLEQQHHDQGHYIGGEYIPPKLKGSPHWCCPQCRREYQPNERPEQYECFCGKEIEPKPQSFLVPHSCGEICGKMLQPQCGHSCMLLCHPGPCSPCAQFATNSCLCSKSKPKSVRCIDKNWKCQEMCRKILPCKHLCNEICHKECPPCGRTSEQLCECGQQVMKRPCSNQNWKCQKVCGRKYSCGIHACKKVCHSGNCGECPLGMPRTCPCGKSSKVGPCSQTIENCGDTCQKLLKCGLHTCVQRCHRGECNECLTRIKKKCRCGMHEKELPCSKEFLCETKCKIMRDCGKHACNRKCCDGECPPCEKICGKQLSCNKHKCQSVCHNGPCYPCNLQSQVNCRCGKTRKNVPCGRERSFKIACLETCRITSKCHHATTHRCHKGECPPCNKKCGLPNDTSGCGHKCISVCHAAVRIKSAVSHQKKYEYKSLPHPRCEEKILVSCIGGHEICEWPCWNSKPSSCQRKCNRKLLCGSHTCQLVCHSVPDIKDNKQQEGCAACEEGCNFHRPIGCTHPCTKPCHLAPCEPCKVNIKSKCHCGLAQVIYKCTEFFAPSSSDQEIHIRQEKLKSCGNRCLKNFPCGHRCTSKCHSGHCPNPESCRKKVKIYCPCQRLKVEITCDKIRTKHATLLCDELCKAELAKVKAIEEKQLEQMRTEEELKNQLEIEQFEKKFGKRKYKERKVVVKAAKTEINWKIISIYAGVIITILLAMVVALYADN